MRFESKKAIPVVAGSGRSGTTWVLDALANSNNLRPVFEPLHPACVPGADFIAYRYIEEMEREGKLLNFFDAVFDGGLHGVWVDYRVRSDRLTPSLRVFRSQASFKEWVGKLRKLLRNRKRFHINQDSPIIVKFIRANLMLNWLVEMYPLRVAYIIRHPGAVVESKLRLKGEDWDPELELDRYRKQAILIDHLPAKAAFLLDEALSPEASHALVWCLENYFPLRDSVSENIRIFTYETLVQQADSEWDVLVEHFELKNRPDAKLLRVPSQQVAPDKLKSRYGFGNLNGWQDAFTGDKLDEMQEVLDIFSIDIYHMINTD